MNIVLRPCQVLLSWMLLISVARSQTVQPDKERLDLSGSVRVIENSISFKTTNYTYEDISNTAGEKLRIRATDLIINGDTLEPAELRTRGKSTLFMRRKSLNFSLKEEAIFNHGDKTKELKKFYAVSLSMDRNYCRNRLAFEMMDKSGLFKLFYAFGELRINGHSEGIYMIIERPEDWAMKKKDSPLVLRRGFNNEIDKIKPARETGKEESSRYRENFRQIYRALSKYEGEELYNILSQWLDMNAYMKWLAFNFFVRNGDYTDEVYFYVDPAIRKFSIIPWDYDDIFAATPHEKDIESIKSLGGKLFFSTEDILDRKIVNDPFLYKVYLDVFMELMNQLSPDVIKKVFENTCAELQPYYLDNDIISNSRYDLRGETNLSLLKDNLSELYLYLLARRGAYIKYIEEYK